MAASSEIAIRVENLSKVYRIGARQERYRTLRDSIMEAVTSPYRRLRGSGDSPADDTIWALKNVSLEIKQGDVVGVIGRNGAGKSTLLKILSKITEPTSGRVRLKGRIASLLEVGTGFHPELTGRENIFLNGSILGMTRVEIMRKFDEIVEFAEIAKFIDTPVKHYSTGMGTRLAFSIAAHLEPEILAVDEVLSVGDLAFRKKCLGKMEDVSRGGRTILFISHEMNAIRRLCQTGVWLHEGQVRTVGAISDVVKEYELSFLSEDANRPSRVERVDVPDSQKYFSWVSISTKDGDPRSAFAFGDTIRLTVGMKGRAAHHTHFVEWFLNESSGGNRVAWGATHALPHGDIPRDVEEISFLIGPLPLAEGRYSIFLAMGVSAAINLDFWHDAISFEIVSADPDGSGHHYSAKYAPTVISYRIPISQH